MAAYVDFVFYENKFGGAAIPEAEFEQYATKASREVDKISQYRIQSEDNPKGYELDKKVKNAVCAVAEVLYKQDLEAASTGGGLVKSETVDSHTVSFNIMDADKAASFWRSEILSAARAYLTTTGLLYRGLGRTCGL